MLVVNGLPYSQGSVAENVSPAEFATSYFDAGTAPGVSEIAVIAVDDLGNFSVAGDVEGFRFRARFPALVCKSGRQHLLRRSCLPVSKP